MYRSSHTQPSLMRSATVNKVSEQSSFCVTEDRRVLRILLESDLRSEVKTLKLTGVTLLIMFLGCSSMAWAEWGYQVTQKVRPGQRAELSLVAPSALKRVTIRLSAPESKLHTRASPL